MVCGVSQNVSIEQVLPVILSMDSTGLDVQLPITEGTTDKSRRCSTAVVAIDLSQEVSLSAADWTLQNYIGTGDHLLLVGILDKTSSNSIEQKSDVGEDHIEESFFKDSWVTSDFENCISPFVSRCLEKGITVDIEVKMGGIESVVADKGIAAGATFLMLDRSLNLEKGKQNNLACKVYQMTHDNEVIVLHEVEQQKSSKAASLSDNEIEIFDEEANAFSMSTDLETDYFTINLEDSSLLAAAGRHGKNANIYSGLQPLPKLISSLEFSDIENSIDIPSTAGIIRSSLATSKFSLPIRSPIQSTASDSPTVFSHSMSRSASDSSFQTCDTDSFRLHTTPASVIPVQEQHKVLSTVKSHGDLFSQYRRNEGKLQKHSDVSLDLMSHVHWTAKGQKEKLTEKLQRSLGKPPTLSKANADQQQCDPQKALDEGAPIIPLQQKPSWSERKPLHLAWNYPPSKSFLQGWSFLCSVCKQTSPILYNIPRKFSFAELEAATDNFSRKNFLAEGGFGFVYRGLLNGQAIAVKQHKLASSQGYKEFRSEVELLSCAQHRNLVMLLGYCDENGHRMLVYEYVCNNSLDWHLSPAKSLICLKWSARRKIAIGAARALRYLHEECRVGCIVHRDMRPNNILLTHDFEPMVGDFGLARSHPEGEDAIETRIIGTFGYLAPEYAESGQVSWKADVYAFGVVLLELICGRKAIDLLRPPGQQSLTEWARPRLLNDATDIIDPRLGNSYDVPEMRAMMRAAYHCIKRDHLQRPRMSQVLYILEGESKDLDEVPKTTGEPPDHRSLNVQLDGVHGGTASLKKQSRKQQSSKPKLLYHDML